MNRKTIFEVFMQLFKSIILLFSLWGFSLSYAAPISFTNVVVFGDSLTDAGSLLAKEGDVGNNYWVAVNGKIGAPITNLDTATQLHPLWINYFVAQYFSDKIIYPVRSSKALQRHPASHNVNYAWASAETNANYLNDNVDAAQPYPPYNNANCKSFGPGLIAPKNACVPGLLRQIDSYLNDVNFRPNAHTLFIIWAGGNDIFNNVAKFLNITHGEPKAEELINNVHKTLSFGFVTNQKDRLELSYPINNLLAAKDKLIAAGVSAEQIYIIDLPNLAKAPAAKILVKNNAALLKIFELVTTLYNANLRLALVYNVFNFHNLPATHIFSVNDLFTKMQNDPQKYHLSNMQDSCTDVADALPGCEGYLFFNEKHPSTHLGKIMGDEFANFLWNQHNFG